MISRITDTQRHENSINVIRILTKIFEKISSKNFINKDFDLKKINTYGSHEIGYFLMSTCINNVATNFSAIKILIKGGLILEAEIILRSSFESLLAIAFYLQNEKPELVALDYVIYAGYCDLNLAKKFKDDDLLQEIKSNFGPQLTTLIEERFCLGENRINWFNNFERGQSNFIKKALKDYSSQVREGIIKLYYSRSSKINHSSVVSRALLTMPLIMHLFPLLNILFSNIDLDDELKKDWAKVEILLKEGLVG